VSDQRVSIGDVNYAHALGQSFIILNSLKDVNELMEKRAENYSDRPSFVMAGELMGINNVSQTGTCNECSLPICRSSPCSSRMVPSGR
jgi:hypothetical protein